MERDRRVAAYGGEFELRARVVASSMGFDDRSLSKVVAYIRDHHREMLSEGDSERLEDGKSLRDKILHGHFRQAVETIVRITGVPWNRVVVRGTFDSGEIIDAEDSPNKAVFGRFLSYCGDDGPRRASVIINDANRILAGLGPDVPPHVVAVFRTIAAEAGVLELRLRMLAGVTEDMADPAPNTKLRSIVSDLREHYGDGTPNEDSPPIESAIDIRDAFVHVRPTEALQLLGQPPADGTLLDQLGTLCAGDLPKRAWKALHDAIAFVEQLATENAKRAVQAAEEHPEQRQSVDEILQTIERAQRYMRRRS